MIELKNVTKDYPMGEVVYRALCGIDLRIDEHEYVAITGVSGSGKSTLMHVIGALHRTTSGEALFDGENLGTLSREELAKIRNKKVGFIFQLASGRVSVSNGSVSRTTRIISQRSSPGGSHNGSPSRGHWSIRRGSSSGTSRRETWTAEPPRKSWSCSPRYTKTGEP